MLRPDGGPAGEAPRPKLTTKTLFVLGAMNMIDCINVNLLTPYVDKMVCDFLNTDPSDKKVTHTVSMLIGLYSICEVCFSPFWGKLADRVGRKPALLVGLGGSAIAPIMFGMATTLPVVFAARALDGFFCGNMGVTRTYLGELVDETTEARGFSFLSVCFSLGLFIGPVLGGELVYIADKMPGVFADTIFDSHPFLLPNLTYAVFAGVSWMIGAAFLEETLPPGARRGCLGFCRGTPAAPTPLPRQRSSSIMGTDPRGAPSSFPMDPDDGVPDRDRFQCAAGVRARCYPAVLLQVIMGFCALAGCASSMTQLFVLIGSIKQEDGGFGLEPSEIGWLQTVAAVGVMCTSLVIYPALTSRLGFYHSFVLGWTVYTMAFALFPVYGLFADASVYGNWRYTGLCIMQLLAAFGGGMCFPTAFAFINRASDGLDKGAANGWANSLGALSRGLVPPAAGWLMAATSQKEELPDHRYIALHTILLLAWLAMLLALPGLRAADRLSMQRRPLMRARSQSGSLPEVPEDCATSAERGARAQPLVGS